MEIKFDRELANKKMIAHLSRVKQGYVQENGRVDGTLKRIENIDLILDDNNLLEKLVDIELTNNIITMTKNIDGSCSNNLLVSCLDKKFEIKPGGTLIVDGKFVTDLCRDELRKYLYDIVGFIYQTYDEVYLKADSEIMDPLAGRNYEKPKSVYNYLDDIDAIKVYKTPRYVNESKDTIIFRTSQIRKELVQMTSDLAYLTTIEQYGSDALPPESREVVFNSILKLFRLQKEMLMLEFQLGKVNEQELENLDKNIEFWANMVASGDLFRSHHIK